MNIKIIFLLILSVLRPGACSPDKLNHEEGQSSEVHQANSVSLTKQQMEAIGLKLGKIEKHNLRSIVKSNGRTKLPPQNKADISVLMGGVVKNIYVFEGDFVKKGQLLATLIHPDIVDMQQQYLENLTSMEFLEPDFQRKKKLYEENIGSGKDYQKALAEFNMAKADALSLKVKLKMLGINITALEQGKISPSINIVSPISGYVRFVEVNIGSFVEPNSEMFEIVDNSKIHVDLLVYEKDIYKIKTGQEVHFSISSMPGRDLTGRIFSVGKAYENEARAITVHAKIDDVEGYIIPGMYVNANIMVDSTTTDALPEAAIVAKGDRHFIFVKTNNQSHTQDHNEPERWFFKKTELIPGIRNSGFIEIKLLAPLPEDTEIAINSAYYLLSEMGKGETEHSD